MCHHIAELYFNIKVTMYLLIIHKFYKLYTTFHRIMYKRVCDLINNIFDTKAFILMLRVSFLSGIHNANFVGVYSHYDETCFVCHVFCLCLRNPYKFCCIYCVISHGFKYVINDFFFVLWIYTSHVKKGLCFVYHFFSRKKCIFFLYSTD